MIETDSNHSFRVQKLNPVKTQIMENSHHDRNVTS